MSLLVRILCEYPDDQPVALVAFEPDSSLGISPDDVHAAISALVAKGGSFELPAVGEPPLPFDSETIRSVMVS